MASNIAVKITADVASLQSQLAIARAEFQQTQKAMNDLARQAATTGLNDKLKSDLQQTSTNMLQAKQRTNELASEMRALQPAAHGGGEAFAFAAEGAKAFVGALTVERVIAFGEAAATAAAHVQHEAEVLALSVTAYQAFSEGAKTAGVQVDAVDTALRRFGASQGQAQSGTGEQAKVFRELGVSAFLPAEQALPKLARALLALNDSAKQSRDMVVLFSRSGVEMRPALEAWAQGTDQLAARMKALGLTFDPEVTEQAHRTDVAMTLAGDHMKVMASGPAVAAKNMLLELGNAWGFVSDETMKAALGLDKANASIAAQKKEAKPDLTGANDPELRSAVALAGALDTSHSRAKDLAAGVAEMRAQLARISGPSAVVHIADPKVLAEDQQSLKSAIAAAQAEIKSLNEKTAFRGTGFSNAGDKAIAQAREAISEINADQTKGDAERRAAIDETYKQLLKGAKLNQAQVLAVETDKNKALTAAARQAATEKRQVDQATAQNEQRIAQVGFDAKRSAIEEEVTAGNLTRQQGFAQLLALTDEETAARLKAVQQAEQGYAADTTFFIQKELEKKLIVAESEAQKAAIRRQAEQASATESAQIWKRSMSEIESVENTFESQLLSGRVGVLGAMEAAGAQFVQEEIKQTIKGLTERLLLSKSEMAADQSLGQLGVLSHWLFEGQKTAATAAGETARVTEKEAARSAGSAADVAAGSATILNDAYKSAAGAYSAVVGIPIVGPILAPIAAGTAFAAVAAFDTLTSLDTGTNYVPRDMPAMIHAGERVVPAADNSAMVAALQGGAANGNGGQVQFHYHAPAGRQTDHAQDAKDMVRMFNHARRTGALKLK